MPTVLIVDDTEDIRILVSLMLTKRGYRVLEAGTGQAGLDTARAERPDLILMDIAMPVMDGLEAIGHLKADATLCNVPVVAFTAHAFEHERNKALTAGANAVVFKPLSVHDLIRTVEQWISTPITSLTAGT